MAGYLPPTTEPFKAIPRHLPNGTRGHSSVEQGMSLIVIILISLGLRASIWVAVASLTAA